MEELKAEKTEVTTQQMVVAMCQAYWDYFRSWPSKDTIRILLAQWALETGWGKSMWCYNVGNAKSRDGDGHDYCYFRCNEILIKSVAERLLREDPMHVQITSCRPDGTCVVWFLPDHSWCRFRAFKTLEDGVYDHLKMVVQKFDKAWPYAVSGDPDGYCRALKEQKYFTADLAEYTKTLKLVFNKFNSLEIPSGPIFTPEEELQVLNSVAMSWWKASKQATHLRELTKEYEHRLDAERMAEIPQTAGEIAQDGIQLMQERVRYLEDRVDELEKELDAKK